MKGINSPTVLEGEGSASNGRSPPMGRSPTRMGNMSMRVQQGASNVLRRGGSKQPDDYDEEAERRTARLAKADSKKRKRLEAAGIDYDFDGYDTTAAKAAKQPKSIKEKKLML